MKRFLILIIFSTLGFSPLYAKDLHISVARIPKVSPNRKEGIFIKIIQAMQNVYPEGKITFDLYPFRRSYELMINNEVDLHLPALGIYKEKLDFYLSKISIGKVDFALYTNKNNSQINTENFENYNVEVDSGNFFYFSPKLRPTTCIKCSLRKVNSRRVDGYLHGAPDSDAIIKSEALSNIRKNRYKTYDIKFAISKKKSEKEVTEINNILNSIIDKMKQAGTYDSLILESEHPH